MRIASQLLDTICPMKLDAKLSGEGVELRHGSGTFRPALRYQDRSGRPFLIERGPNRLFSGPGRWGNIHPAESKVCLLSMHAPA